jgi:tetratricopeptide (TPR) repeat protein
MTSVTEKQRDAVQRPARLQVASAADPLASPDQEALHQRLSQANLSRQRGQWNEAIEHCVAVLRAQPGDAAAHSLLGDIYRDQGKYEDAIHWYRTALDLHPNAADRAKLQEMEQKRGGPQQSPGRLKPAGQALPPHRTGPFPVGTVQLMGLEPQRWLRGMTLVALGFTGLMLMLLILQRTHPKSAPIPQPYPAPSALPSTTGEAALSLSPAPGSAPPRRPGAAGDRSVVGSGLPPDLSPGNAANPSIPETPAP